MAFFDLYVKFLKERANYIITNFIKKLISLDLRKYMPLNSENYYLVITINIQNLAIVTDSVSLYDLTPNLLEL